MRNRVCVVHLIWEPLGLAPFKRFISSYAKHSAGSPHDLLLVFNGFLEPSTLGAYQKIAEEIPHKVLFLKDRVWDLEAYKIASTTLSSEFICYLNSHSVISADDWLAKMIAPLKRGSAGLVGATGNAESLYTDILLHATISSSRSAVRRVQQLAVNFLISEKARRAFPSHPNFHIRTNGFAGHRELLLKCNLPRLRSKFDCHKFESGKWGLSAQVRSWGTQTLVVGRDGRCFGEDEWSDSATFRSWGQKNLLIEDNQTRDYASSSLFRRLMLYRASWIGVGDCEGICAQRVVKCGRYGEG